MNKSKNDILDVCYNIFTAVIYFLTLKGNWFLSGKPFQNLMLMLDACLTAEHY